MESQGGGAGAATIMEFWTMVEYYVVFLKYVAVVAVIIRLGCDKGSGSVLSGGSFECASYGNIEGVGTVEGSLLGISELT